MYQVDKYLVYSVCCIVNLECYGPVNTVKVMSSGLVTYASLSWAGLILLRVDQDFVHKLSS